MKLITDTEAFDDLEPEWMKLVEKTESSVFQTYQWNRIWWKHFGKENSLRIAAFYDDGELIGLAPFFIDTVKLFAFPVYRCLRLIGSNVSQPDGKDLLGLISYTDYLDIIVLPGFEKQVYSRLNLFFQNSLNEIDQVMLDTIPEGSKIWDMLLTELKMNGQQYRVEDCDPSQLINVNCSWGEYLKHLSKNRRYQARRHLRRAIQPDKKIFDVVEAESEQEALKYFDIMVDMHQKKWNKYGSLGAFYEKRSYDFHREITRVFYRQGWIQFKVAIPVESKNTYAGIDLNYKYNKRIYGVHTAIDDESPYYSSGPGMVMLNLTLYEATHGEIDIYDFLRGDESYKSSISDIFVENRNVCIESPKAVRNLKAAAVRRQIHLRRYSRRNRELFKLMFEDKSTSEAIMDAVSLVRERVFMRFKLG